MEQSHNPLWGCAKTYGTPARKWQHFSIQFQGPPRYSYLEGMVFQAYFSATASCSRDKTGTVLKANEKLYQSASLGTEMSFCVIWAFFFLNFPMPGKECLCLSDSQEQVVNVRKPKSRAPWYRLLRGPSCPPEPSPCSLASPLEPQSLPAAIDRPLDGGTAAAGVMGGGASCTSPTLPGLHGHSLGGPHPLTPGGRRGRLAQVLG